MTNKRKSSVRLITWGAGIQALRVPNDKGIFGDVVLGFDSMDGIHMSITRLHSSKYINYKVIVNDKNRLLGEKLLQKPNRQGDKRSV